MWLSLLVIAALSIMGYFLGDNLISDMKVLFLKAGLFGRDLNKKSDDKIPESLGVVVGTAYLIIMFLFIPVPFFDIVLDKNFDHEDVVQFLCASLLSVCCMIFLGFADDVLELRWRHKLFLPTTASLPLLMLYFISGGSTTVVLPLPLRPFLGKTLYIGFLYYIYMGMLAVFCTNSINILSGINGVEVGQSVVIASSVILYLGVELLRGLCCSQQYLMSLCVLLPFLGTSLALYKHNKYPSKVFVGDTFCYFAGMTFAVSGILGHFSKTLLLFFMPQILNFLYSIPQLFGLIPCPRHRLPRLNKQTDLLEMSRVSIKVTHLPKLGQLFYHVARTVGLIHMKEEEGGEVSINNLTIINFILKTVGPTHEGTLTNIVLAVQVGPMFAQLLGFLV